MLAMRHHTGEIGRLVLGKARVDAAPDGLTRQAPPVARHPEQIKAIEPVDHALA
jgi:hypothetical protein